MFLTSLCFFCVVTLIQAPKSQPDRTIITFKPVSASLFRRVFSACLPHYHEPNGPLSKASVMLLHIAILGPLMTYNTLSLASPTPTPLHGS